MYLPSVHRPITRVLGGKPQTLIPSAYRASTQIPFRLFHSSKPSLKDDHEYKNQKLDREIRKLKQLKNQYQTAGFIEKFKIRAKLIEQEAKVASAQEYQPIPQIKTPKYTFGEENPLELKTINRLETIHSYILMTFIKECETYQFSQTAANPNIILNNIVDDFKDSHPEVKPMTKDEILFYFHIFHDLANNVTFVDELKFENETVSKILLEFVKTEPGNDLQARAESVAKNMNVDEGIIVGWFNIFSILSSSPFSSQDKKFTCPICPYEYTKFQSFSNEFNAIQDKLAKFYGDIGSKDTKNQSKSSKNDQKNDKKKTMEFDINLNSPPMRYFQFGLLGGLILFLVYSMVQDGNQEISFQEFSSKYLSKNLVSKLVVVNNRTAYIELNDIGKQQFGEHEKIYFNIGSIEAFERNLRDVQNELNMVEDLKVPVIYVTEGNIAKLLVNFLPTLLFLGAIYYMTKKANVGGMGGPLGFGKSTAKKFNQETNIKIRFKDVAGMSEAKQEVMEFVKFLQNPEKYEKLGAKIPRGAILSGPPGSGKTLIAKATAGEAGVPFYSVSGSEFVEMFVGVGASRVRDLFKTAQENAPSIVFVDEIDAIGKSRSKGNASGANDERETTLNQLLVEMDGFESHDHVVVLAGTNRADILDRALMRPGRFDRHIAIDNPELQGRKEIFDVHLKKIKLAENIDPDLPGRLAALTPGFSGADIANVCNEAALIGARYNADLVTLKHFELAIERVIGGIEKKSKILNAQEQKVVAYHEAGHAVCGWYLEYAHPLLKVSIIPRGQGALGYAQYLPPDQYLISTKQLIDRMIMTLGGRVSEELHFSSVTGGAHDDFKKVTQMAQSMVLRFGMSKKIGMVNYADTQSQDNLTKPFSDETNRLIDEEIHRIVIECHDKCRQLLQEKSKEVELVAQELIKKEFITREDMIRLLGKRPYPEQNDAFDKYLDGKPA